MPFKGIPRGSVYINGTPFNKLKLPYKRDDIERQKYCNLE